MNAAFAWGALLALASAVFSLVLFLTGFQTEKLATGQFLQWLGFPIMIVILVLGGRSQAASRAPAETGYGRAFGWLLLVTLIGGFLTGLYNFIHFQFINPDFPEYVSRLTEARLETMGMSAAKIEEALRMQEAFLTPVVQGLVAFGGTLFFGFIFSLIIAIFVRRPATVAAPPPLS